MFKSLDALWAKLVEGFFGLSLESRAGEVVWYFLHAASTIRILLGVERYVISVIRTFISTEKIKKFIENHEGPKSNLMVSLLGIVGVGYLFNAIV